MHSPMKSTPYPRWIGKVGRRTTAADGSRRGDEQGRPRPTLVAPRARRQGEARELPRSASKAEMRRVIERVCRRDGVQVTNFSMTRVPTSSAGRSPSACRQGPVGSADAVKSTWKTPSADRTRRPARARGNLAGAARPCSGANQQRRPPWSQTMWCLRSPTSAVMCQSEGGKDLAVIEHRRCCR